CIALSILLLIYILYYLFFFFNDTATTEIYTLSLHDALPIFGSSRSSSRGSIASARASSSARFCPYGRCCTVRSASVSSPTSASRDRKSTRLNSSHVAISYAVFCLKKKKKMGGVIVRNTKIQA